MTALPDQLFPNGVKGIIFDCDGVMIDSADGNRHLYNFVLAEVGLPPMTREQEIFAFQATFREALERLVPAHLLPDIDAAIAKIDYDRDVVSRIKLMPGFVHFIEEAHKRQIRLAIDTNRTDFGINRILDFFHLPPYFDPVISSSIAPDPKPSPAGADMILNAWQLAPEDALFVGDSADDGLAARSSHIPFAAFGPGPLKGDIKVESWPELAQLLWNG